MTNKQRLALHLAREILAHGLTQIETRLSALPQLDPVQQAKLALVRELLEACKL